MTTLATINTVEFQPENNPEVNDIAHAMLVNNSLLMDTFFQGLFVVARRFLGYSPRGTSFPFTTRAFSQNQLKNSIHERQDLQWGRDNGRIIIEPNAATPSVKGREALTLQLDGTDHQLEKQLWKTNELREPEDKLKFNANDTKALNSNAIYSQLVHEYWDSMLRFARNNQSYHPAWQQVGA